MLFMTRLRFVGADSPIEFGWLVRMIPHALTSLRAAQPEIDSLSACSLISLLSSTESAVPAHKGLMETARSRLLRQKQQAIALI